MVNAERLDVDGDSTICFKKKFIKMSDYRVWSKGGSLKRDRVKFPVYGSDFRRRVAGVCMEGGWEEVSNEKVESRRRDCLGWHSEHKQRSQISSEEILFPGDTPHYLKNRIIHEKYVTENHCF